MQRNLRRWAGCFTKGLPHTQSGEVEPGKYERLLKALASGKGKEFNQLERASGRTLVNPQAAYAYTLEGADCCAFGCPPPPALSSAEAAAEMVELYWQALARDVPFAEYGSSPLIRRAAEELGSLSGFAGPRNLVATITARGTAVPSTAVVGSLGSVTPANIFRGTSPGDLKGPLISQFLWKDVPYGSGKLQQRYRSPVKAIDYLNSYEEWLQLQNGFPPWPGSENQ